MPLVGKRKKKQITGTFTVTMSGLFLPMQLIYKGKSPRCLPQGITFPENFNLTFTPNHWGNEDKVIEHLEKIVFPFVVEKRKELSLPDEQNAILVFDVFKGQKTERVQSLIADNNCISVFVPANMTNYFQPLDLTVNGPAKQFLKGKFQEWYATPRPPSWNSRLPILAKRRIRVSHSKLNRYKFDQKITVIEKTLQMLLLKTLA